MHFFDMPKFCACFYIGIKYKLLLISRTYHTYHLGQERNFCWVLCAYLFVTRLTFWLIQTTFGYTVKPRFWILDRNFYFINQLDFGIFFEQIFPKNVNCFQPISFCVCFLCQQYYWAYKEGLEVHKRKIYLHFTQLLSPQLW